ncbi:hypothetical protein BOX15_Mlig021784g1 [Macrostomum lignano]|uniref:Uncharacterized protein n=1 Tax=Macrostomum lignano TaxID=282301 RepID=A0A267GQE4_9PLAT|nr:hypothetical protein BOX15_Mlig021784g1 [Macrostomum lignano]
MSAAEVEAAADAAARCPSPERLIGQIDALNRRNHELERTLAGLQHRLGVERRAEIDLDLANQRLSGELETVDKLAQRLEAEKAEALKAADAEIANANMERDRAQQRAAAAESRCTQLDQDRKKLQDSLNDTKKQAASSTMDNRQLQELIAQQQADKKRLTQRIEKLTANERELVLEIERLRRKGSGANGTTGGKKASAATTSKIEQYLKGIEEDRDYWKHEAEELNKMLRTPAVLNGSRSSSPTRLSRTPSKTRLSSPSKPAKTAGGGKSGTRKPPQSTEPTLSKGLADAELSRYASTRSRARSPPTRDRPSANNGGVGSASDDSELLRVKRERDELQALLDKFERHMAEIQGNVRVLTQERDQLSRLLDDTNDELHRARRELLASPSQPKVSLAAQAVLKRVETERDDALADLRRMMTERDSLRERLKVATETALSDKARLEQRIEDLQNAARKTATERDDLGTRSAQLRQRCQELEDQTKQLQRGLAERTEELSNERAISNQQRMQAEAAQRTGRQLEADLLQAQDAANLLQDRCITLEREIKALRDDQAQMRTAMANLDYEKDSLEGVLRERTDRARALEDELKAKEAQAGDLRTQLHHAEYQLGRAQDQLAAREKELRQSRKSGEATQNDLAAEKRRVEALQREVARLQDDLQALARDNSSLQAELQETVQEREQFKHKAQDYVAEVRRVEELLSQKERERSDLLEQYRLLTAESDKYQAEAHQLESDASSLRLELSAKDADCKRLREKLEQAESDLQDNRRSINSYELQVANLSRSVSDLEDSLRQQQCEREEVLKDLSALRDLCAKLESSKDQAQRQLTSKALDADQLAGQLDDLQHENDLLREQLLAEQDAKKSLETVLSASREKEFQTQLDSQERHAELSMLRERLELGETKLEQQGRELTRLRSRSSELESEVERLTRQLSSERFERERLASELRRSGGGSGGGGGGGGAGLYGSHATRPRLGPEF